MIQVAIARRYSSAPAPAELRRLCRFVLAAEGVAEAEISLAIVDNETIHAINHRHLAHDYPTDVLTFPLSSPGETLTAEIVVGGEYAESEAAAHGWTPREELLLYVTHGLLHLCGHDDHQASARRRMVARQTELLDGFLAAPGRKAPSGRASGRHAVGRRASGGVRTR